MLLWAVLRVHYTNLFVLVRNEHVLGPVNSGNDDDSRVQPRVHQHKLGVMNVSLTCTVFAPSSVLL